MPRAAAWTSLALGLIAVSTAAPFDLTDYASNLLLLVAQPAMAAVVVGLRQERAPAPAAAPEAPASS